MPSYRKTRPKDRGLVIFGIATLEDVYGLVRIKVPYRPKADYADGIDCTSADDVFRLYWRYTEPNKMGYMSTTTRELHNGGTHAEKVAGELALRKCKRIVLERGKSIPTWLENAIDSDLYEVVKVMPSRSLPPGMNPDEFNYFEKRAWQLVYAYMQKLPWPKTQLTLTPWRPVGSGKDVSKRNADAARSGDVEYKDDKGREWKGKRARMLTKDETEAISAGTLTMEMLEEQGVSLNPQSRQHGWNLQQYAVAKGLGVWHNPELEARLEKKYGKRRS